MDTTTIIEALTNEITRLKATIDQKNVANALIATHAEWLCVAVHNERPQDVKEALAEELRRVIREHTRERLPV